MNSIEKIKTWVKDHKTEIQAGAATIGVIAAGSVVLVCAGALSHKIRLDRRFKSTLGFTTSELFKNLDSGMLDGETYRCYMSNPGIYGKNISIQDCGKLGQEFASFAGKELTGQVKEVSGVVLMLRQK